jgi:hypothetical protein
MKKITKILFTILLASTFVGCQEFLDVNTNPDKVSSVDVSLILPGAQTSMMATFGGSYHNLGGFWAQYYTQSPDAGQYENIDEYRVETDFFDREWSEIYAGGLANLRTVKDISAEKGYTNYALVATLCEAYTFHMLADLYNAVPYSEALNGVVNTSPKFDNGADIYPALIAEIDAAIAAYDANPSDKDMSNADFIFGGNMSDWIGFANTLKLKMYMRQSYTSAPKSAEILALLAEDNFITSDAAITQFVGEQNKRNPYYEIQVDRLGGVNQSASNTLLGYLLDKGDPRVDGIYDAGGSGHKAKEQGDFANRDISNGDLSTPNITATTPVYFFSMAELHFLKAEALVRYSAGAGAQAEYEAGIDESFNMHGMSGASTLYASGGVYEYTATGDVENDIKQIMMQKWIAMANFQNLEAFFEVNRTQVPALSANEKGTPGNIGERTLSYASILTGTNTPRRLLVPDVETVRNANAPGNPANGLSTKVWWDSK